jgi:hypothetical protein
MHALVPGGVAVEEGRLVLETEQRRPLLRIEGVPGASAEQTEQQQQQSLQCDSLGRDVRMVSAGWSCGGRKVAGD